MIPDFSYEQRMRKRGYKLAVYIDEVGVGPLAGPVTVCAVYVRGATPRMLRSLTLKDSKQLSPKKREELHWQFLNIPEISFAISRVMPSVIDRMNIFQATQFGARRALLALEKQMGEEADFVLLDGRLKVALAREQLAMPKADEQIATCAIASIIAKVTRDRTMLRYHKKYPQYRFDLHKGYGTKLHYEMLKKYGASPIHRVSFLNGSTTR